jgi:hypothetical protein
VEGVQKVRAGSKVTPVPATTVDAAAPATPAAVAQATSEKK